MGQLNETAAVLRPPRAKMCSNLFKEGHLRHVCRVSLQDMERQRKLKLIVLIADVSSKMTVNNQEN